MSFTGKKDVRMSAPFHSLEEQIHMKQKGNEKLMGNFGKVRPVIGMEYPFSSTE